MYSMSSSLPLLCKKKSNKNKYNIQLKKIYIFLCVPRKTFLTHLRGQPAQGILQRPSWWKLEYHILIKRLKWSQHWHTEFVLYFHQFNINFKIIFFYFRCNESSPWQFFNQILSTSSLNKHKPLNKWFYRAKKKSKTFIQPLQDQPAVNRNSVRLTSVILISETDWTQYLYSLGAFDAIQ